MTATLKTAYDRLNAGKLFVRICDLRRELGWSREDFDATIKSLRNEYRIQLHPGDTLWMTDAEVRNGFTDENGGLWLNLSWWM